MVSDRPASLSISVTELTKSYGNFYALNAVSIATLHSTIAQVHRREAEYTNSLVNATFGSWKKSC